MGTLGVTIDQPTRLSKQIVTSPTDQDIADNFNKSLKAFKDILYFYMSLVEYNCLFTDLNFEDGNFDINTFIDYKYCEDHFYLNDEQTAVLNNGSGIRLICRVLQSWDQGLYPAIGNYYTDLAKALVSSRRLDHLPDIRDFLSDALTDITNTEVRQQVLFDKYVLGDLSQLFSPALSVSHEP